MTATEPDASEQHNCRKLCRRLELVCSNKTLYIMIASRNDVQVTAIAVSMKKRIARGSGVAEKIITV